MVRADERVCCGVVSGGGGNELSGEDDRMTARKESTRPLIWLSRLLGFKLRSRCGAFKKAEKKAVSELQHLAKTKRVRPTVPFKRVTYSLHTAVGSHTNTHARHRSPNSGFSTLNLARQPFQPAVPLALATADGDKLLSILAKSSLITSSSFCASITCFKLRRDLEACASATEVPPRSLRLSNDVHKYEYGAVLLVGARHRASDSAS